MIVITGLYANLTRSAKTEPWPGGPKSYLRQPVIVSPVIQQTKDRGATDSCVTLIGAHQCGVLMADVG